jgi:hypothetical protein
LRYLWKGLPITLVHGGFYGKNVRVQNRNGRAVLFAFDWESAGYGTLAAEKAPLNEQPPAVGTRERLYELVAHTVSELVKEMRG